MELSDRDWEDLVGFLLNCGSYGYCYGYCSC